MFPAVLSIALLATSAGPAPARTVKIVSPSGTTTSTRTRLAAQEKEKTPPPAREDFSSSPVFYDDVEGGDCCPPGHIPHAWKSQGDMYPHYPYLAEPKFYYYFRPYQAYHIARHQSEVLNYGGDPRNPYDNKVFRNIYEGLELPEPLPKPAAPIIPDVDPAPAPVEKAPAAENPPPQASRRQPAVRHVDISAPNTLRQPVTYAINDDEETDETPVKAAQPEKSE